MGDRPRQQHDLEGLRRSLAMADDVPRDQIERLLDECGRLLAERVRIERILADLDPAWGGHVGRSTSYIGY